jgi:hypothetical protein
MPRHGRVVQLLAWQGGRYVVVAVAVPDATDHTGAGIDVGSPDCFVLRQPGLAFPLLRLLARAGAHPAHHRREERDPAGPVVGAGAGAGAGGGRGSTGAVTTSEEVRGPETEARSATGARCAADPGGATTGTWRGPEPGEAAADSLIAAEAAGGRAGTRARQPTAGRQPAQIRDRRSRVRAGQPAGAGRTRLAPRGTGRQEPRKYRAEANRAGADRARADRARTTCPRRPTTRRQPGQRIQRSRRR